MTQITKSTQLVSILRFLKPIELYKREPFEYLTTRRMALFVELSQEPKEFPISTEFLMDAKTIFKMNCKRNFFRNRGSIEIFCISLFTILLG